MLWIKQNGCHFYDGHNELYHHAKFGGDRTTHAGCRCENMMFVTMFLSVTLRGRSAIFAIGGHVLRCRLLAGFNEVSGVFSDIILLFPMHYTVLIFVARWRHNFREIAVKNCENPKIRRKSLCAPLRIDS